MTWKAAVILLGLAAISTAGQAETYPSRPVRVVLPFGAGGVADITARLVTEKMGDRLGQRFVIENAPGAGGSLAAQRVATAPADGYSLALFSNGTAVSVALFKALPFDPVRDFLPISTMGTFDFVLAANSASAYRNLGDFIRAAQARPGALNVGPSMSAARSICQACCSRPKLESGQRWCHSAAHRMRWWGCCATMSIW